MSNSARHAYLIMAHNKFEQLKCLLDLLDDPRNDIYLHIDKKAKVRDLGVKLKHSNLIMVDPIRVTWGGHSQIDCEMLLFKNAAPKHYMYYHLISGVDLPIKTQDEIHAFFQEHAGKSFIGYDKNAIKTGNFLFRTQYYHLFRNVIGRSRKLWVRVLKKIERLFMKLQRAVHFKRKDIIPLYKGANWVSITDEMVQFVLGCEKIIKKQFYYSLCADEVFLHSVAMYSPYRDKIIDDTCREIDWNRGEPYTYRKEDVPNLLASSAMFARKFDCDVDQEAIDLIVDDLKKRSNNRI